MISTGAVPDYAERRFKLHCDDAERLVAALTSASSDGVRLAAELGQRDGLFPNVLEAVAGGSGEHTPELQSQSKLGCRPLLEKKKDTTTATGRGAAAGVLRSYARPGPV